jgi:hypothetical protein
MGTLEGAMVSEFSVQLSAQDADLLISQIDFREIALNALAAGNGSLEADVT